MFSFELIMQSEKRYYSPANVPFNKIVWYNTRRSGSYRTGTLLSIAVGLIVCLVVFMIISRSPLAKKPSGEEDKPRYEKTEINRAVRVNDKIAVAES